MPLGEDDRRATPGERLYVGVIGPGDEATDRLCEMAADVGRLLAAAGHIVVTGGLGGVMAAACRGAAQAGGVTIGILPGSDRRDANPHLTVSLPTGLEELRDGLVVRSADVLISVGGSWGTLIEVALGVRTGVPVVSLAGWTLPSEGVQVVDSAEDAVAAAQRLAIT